MPVVTRSQSNASRKLAVAKDIIEETAFNQLIESLRELNTNFPNKRAIRQSNLLSNFMDNTTHLLEPSIQYIAKNVDVINLKLLTVLHNRILHLATQLEKCGLVSPQYKAFKYTNIIAKCLEKYIDKMTIQYISSSV
jgi:hypothetical protein